MNIVVNINKEDFWRFNRFALFHLPKYRNMIFAAFAGTPLLFFVVLKLTGWGWAYSIIGGLILGGLFNLYFVYRIKSKTMKLVKDHDGILGEHLIEIDERGLHESSVNNHSRYAWTGIQQLRMDKDYLYIFVNNLQAVIIPKRSFSGQKEELEFSEAVERYSHQKFE